MSYLTDLLGQSYKEGMTEEEISTALQGLNLVSGGQVEDSNKLKNLLSKANSEASEYKKQLRAKQSEQEKQEAERVEKFNALTEENNKLNRQLSILNYKSELIKTGYGSDLAESTATAMVDGDMATVLKNQGLFVSAQTQQLKTTILEDTPRPSVGSSTVQVDYYKKSEEAGAMGDKVAQAQYLRMAQQSSNTNN